MNDYRDLVIETLLESEAMLQERVAGLEADIDVYRELVSVGLEQAHERETAIRRLRDQYHRLVAEHRALRAAYRRAA